MVNVFPNDDRELYDAIRIVVSRVADRIDTPSQIAAISGRASVALRARTLALKLLAYAEYSESSRILDRDRRQYAEYLTLTVQSVARAQGSQVKSERMAVIQAVATVAALRLQEIVETIEKRFKVPSGVGRIIYTRQLHRWIAASLAWREPAAAARAIDRWEAFSLAASCWNEAEAIRWQMVADLLDELKLQEELGLVHRERIRSDDQRRGLKRRATSGATLDSLRKAWNRYAGSKADAASVLSEIERQRRVFRILLPWSLDDDLRDFDIDLGPGKIDALIAEVLNDPRTLQFA